VRRKNGGLTKSVLGFLLSVPFIVALTGCSNRPITLYLFGPAKSCFYEGRKAQCQSLKVYDQIELKASPEKQEVIYLRKGLGLDESNTVFRKLDNCKVVDRDNFSCEGLTRTNGGFTNSKSFGDLTVSTSYFTYAFSYYTGSEINRATVDFFHKNDSWINPAVIVLAIVVILCLLGAMADS
jgi:hypothetical protein